MTFICHDRGEFNGEVTWTPTPRECLNYNTQIQVLDDDNKIIASAAQVGDAPVSTLFNYAASAQQIGSGVAATLNVCILRYENLANHRSGPAMCFDSTCITQPQSIGAETLGPIDPMQGADLQETALLPVAAQMLVNEVNLLTGEQRVFYGDVTNPQIQRPGIEICPGPTVSDRLRVALENVRALFGDMNTKELLDSGVPVSADALSLQYLERCLYFFFEYPNEAVIGSQRATRIDVEVLVTLDQPHPALGFSGSASFTAADWMASNGIPVSTTRGLQSNDLDLDDDDDVALCGATNQCFNDFPLRLHMRLDGSLDKLVVDGGIQQEPAQGDGTGDILNDDTASQAKIKTIVVALVTAAISATCCGVLCTLRACGSGKLCLRRTSHATKDSTPSAPTPIAMAEGVAHGHSNDGMDDEEALKVAMVASMA